MWINTLLHDSEPLSQCKRHKAEKQQVIINQSSVTSSQAIGLNGAKYYLGKVKPQDNAGQRSSDLGASLAGAP